MDGRLVWYARYAWRAAARHEIGPLFYGVALTDRCNLGLLRMPDPRRRPARPHLGRAAGALDGSPRARLP